MIEIKLTVTFKQFSEITQIITPSQLLQMSDIMNNTSVMPTRPPEPVKASNEPRNGFKRPEVLTAVQAGGAVTLDEMDPVPTATRKKGGKKGPKMPALGRTNAEIAEFVKHEETRTEELDEEEELKKQRAEERDARKAEKDAVATAKKEQAIKEQDEVDAIKAKDAQNTAEQATALAPKPWQL